MDGGRAAAAFDFFVRHLASHTVGDVVADGAREQERFLLDDADLAAQVVARVLLEFDAVEQDAPAGVVVEARQQVDQRRLARTGGTHQRHDLARLHA